ncbi:Defective in cullin neddylation protein [Zea mays]|uniref:Defective in cullin neddylation protein n=1 Tax=Zea mays TaxID=4577 RepID=A0A1D6QEP4_MAIZE|nr:Defective in cullin neddylation protein [Zea mays]
MHKLGRGSRDKVQQFMAITGASEKAALQALKASDWHLEGAFDVFYSQPQIAVANTRHLEELYNRYKGVHWWTAVNRVRLIYAIFIITCATTRDSEV